MWGPNNFNRVSWESARILCRMVISSSHASFQIFAKSSHLYIYISFSCLWSASWMSVQNISWIYRTNIHIYIYIYIYVYNGSDQNSWRGIDSLYIYVCVSNKMRIRYLSFVAILYDTYLIISIVLYHPLLLWMKFFINIWKQVKLSLVIETIYYD